MPENPVRDHLTICFAAEALEASNQHRGEAVSHLLDAAGSIIVGARKDGYDPVELALEAAQYLIGQVMADAGGEE